MLNLSVLVPVFNEEHLVEASLRRLRVLDSSPHLGAVEVIVVDDGLTELGRDCGLVDIKVIPFNHSGSLAWWLNGKLLKRTNFSRFQVLLLNWLTPVFRRLEALLPLPALSLIALMDRPAGDDLATPQHRPGAGAV